MVTMLLCAVAFFVSAMIAAMLAFPVSVGAAVDIAKNLFFVFSILSAAFLIYAMTQKIRKVIF